MLAVDTSDTIRANSHRHFQSDFKHLVCYGLASIERQVGAVGNDNTHHGMGSRVRYRQASGLVWELFVHSLTN